MEGKVHSYQINMRGLSGFIWVLNVCIKLTVEAVDSLRLE